MFSRDPKTDEEAILEAQAEREEAEKRAATQIARNALYAKRAAAIAAEDKVKAVRQVANDPATVVAQMIRDTFGADLPALVRELAYADLDRVKRKLRTMADDLEAELLKAQIRVDAEARAVASAGAQAIAAEKAKVAAAQLKRHHELEAGAL